MIAAVEILILLAVLGVVVGQLFVVRKLSEGLMLRHRVNDKHAQAIRREAATAAREAAEALRKAQELRAEAQKMHRFVERTLKGG